MARLIDADKRIAENKKLYCDGCNNYGGAKCRACWVDDAMCLIDDAPTVDAVPVVRCRDCKWFAENNGGEWYGCWLFHAILATKAKSHVKTISAPTENERTVTGMAEYIELETAIKQS